MRFNYNVNQSASGAQSTRDNPRVALVNSVTINLTNEVTYIHCYIDIYIYTLAMSCVYKS